jgi:hypothetical protein
MIRDAGVQLPKFGQQKDKMTINVDHLNNMIKESGYSTMTKKNKKA